MVPVVIAMAILHGRIMATKVMSNRSSISATRTLSGRPSMIFPEVRFLSDGLISLLETIPAGFLFYHSVFHTHVPNSLNSLTSLTSLSSVFTSIPNVLSLTIPGI